MPPEQTTIIFITFLLAIIGYTGLTVIVLFSFQGKIPFLIWRIIAAIILIHVAMVWTYHYNWQFSAATRNGYIGFIIFHSALLIILFSTILKENIARNLIHISFVAVTIGALGAVFRYDVVKIYTLPVILCSLAGSAGLFWFYWKKLR